MECRFKIRPADDRDSDELKAWELPDTDAERSASCPLMKTITLLPLRYGRVETPPPRAGAGMPHTLKSRPVGYRMLRDGFIYIYDEDAGELKEYEYRMNELSGGPMEYPVDHSLHVYFSDVQWTEKKKAQVTDSAEERAWWMQEVKVSACGGTHLLTVEQAKEQVAEFFEDYQPEEIEDSYEEETTPYIWEHQPYYHKTRVGKLLKQQNVLNPDECLCLVLKDDIGVLLDLSKHQENVIGWIEQWRETDNNERDYVLGSWIESLTQTDDQAILDAINSQDDEPLEELFEETDQEQRQLIYDYLSVERDNPEPFPLGPEGSYENHSGTPLSSADSAREKMRSSLGNELYRKHHKTIDRLVRNNDIILNGKGGFDRGINQLIDRRKMKQDMNRQAVKLTRWQDFLDIITEDRTYLLCNNIFHGAAWYFDGDEQLETAVDYEYEVYKDLCRSDKAIEDVLTWMRKYPQYNRLMFHTLPKKEQFDPETIGGYLKISSAGFELLTGTSKWIEYKSQLESGYLSRVDEASNSIKDQVAAVRDNLAPAVAKSMAEAHVAFFDALGRPNMPSLNELFPGIGYAAIEEMLNAVENGEYAFKITSKESAIDLGTKIRETLDVHRELASYANQIDYDARDGGHKRPEYKEKKLERVEAQKSKFELWESLEKYYFPVTPNDALFTDTTNSGQSQTKSVKPGDQPASIALLVPPAIANETTRVYRDIKAGLHPSQMSNPTTGLATAIFLAQLANLWEIHSSEELKKKEDYLILYSGSWASTIASGLATVQVISDNAVMARAERLTSVWHDAAGNSAYATLGKLHVSLGGVAFGFALVASSIATFQYSGKAMDALKRGDYAAMAGALTSAGAHAGSATVHGVGLAKAMIAVKEFLKGAGNSLNFWSTVGTKMVEYARRMTYWEIGFLAVQVVGSDVYDYFNLSPLDKWMLSTPWSTDENLKEDSSLERYQARLLDVTDVVDIERKNDSDEACINLYSIPSDALDDCYIPGSKQMFSIHLSSWAVAKNSSFLFSNEVWHPNTRVLTEYLVFDRSDHFLKLKFDIPSAGPEVGGHKDNRSLVPKISPFNLFMMRNATNWEFGDFVIEISIVRDDDRWESPVKHYRFRGNVGETATLLPDDSIVPDTSRGLESEIIKDPMHVTFE